MDEKREKGRLLEDLASSILLAEPGDEGSLLQLAGHLEALAWRIPPGSSPDLPERLHILAGKVQALGSTPAEEAETKMEELRKEVSLLLEGPLAGSPSGGEKERPGPSPTSQEEGFTLPDFVEEEVFQEFMEGSRDALAEIESLVLSLEDRPDLALPDLKRKLHTLKGEAGLLGLADLERVCHSLEDLLETQEPRAETVDLLLEAKDWISQALKAYGERRLPPKGPEDLLQAIKEEKKVKDTPPAGSENPSPLQADSSPQGEWDEDSLTLVGEFLEESAEGLAKVDGILLSAENEGISSEQVDALFRVFHTIKGLAGFLELEDITRLAHTTEALLDQARKEKLRIGGPRLDLLFDSTETMGRMLSRLKARLAEGKRPEACPDLPNLLARIEAATGGERPHETGPPAQSSTAPKVEKGPPPFPARKEKNPPRSKSHKLTEFVKVDLQRVDTLVALIGELVISETMVVNSPELQNISSPRLRKQISQMSKITNDLQDLATRMRMVPVRDVFQKMARMVRDLSRKTGKAVRTEIEGASTEIDRGMVEQLGDPLVHIIRNAVDHGIEPPEERERAGKPPTGTIYLRARHQGGNVVIEAADDGKGLDRKAILAKAREKGLVKGEEALTDQEVYNLIFAPGFSTAKKLTEISGRGVGMDVVRRNIESIRGSVSISSIPGKGSTIQLILPLTMAIIDGMLVTCGEERYIIPTLSVVESIKPEPGMIFSIARKREVLSVRGETIPLFRLDRLLEIRGAVQDPLEGLAVIVESHGKKVGILLDDVLTQQQVVIKSLETSLPNTEYLSGAAILSDGRVGLILNIGEITALDAGEPPPCIEAEGIEPQEETS